MGGSKLMTIMSVVHLGDVRSRLLEVVRKEGEACKADVASALGILKRHDFPPSVLHRALELYETFLAKGGTPNESTIAACALVASKIESYATFAADVDAIEAALQCVHVREAEVEVLRVLQFDVAFPTTYQLAQYTLKGGAETVSDHIISFISIPGLLAKYGRELLCTAAIGLAFGSVENSDESAWHPIARKVKNDGSFPQGDDVILPENECAHKSPPDDDARIKEFGTLFPMPGAKGAIGTCFLTIKNGEKLVLKKFKTTEDGTVPWSMIHEVAMLKLLPPCQYIVSLVEPHALLGPEEGMFAVYEVGKIDLLNLAIQMSVENIFKIAPTVMVSLFAALSFIHSFGLVHGDVKPENILLCGQYFKLADFGFCSFNVPGPTYGSRNYMSPELLLNQSFDEKVDIWAAGCVLYVLTKGELFVALEEENTVEGVKKKYAEALDDKRFQGLNQDVKSLIKALFQVDPRKRPSADEALDDAYCAQAIVRRSAQPSQFMADHVKKLFGI